MNSTTRLTLFIVILVLLTATACVAEETDELLIYFVDVGKGDAALVGTPNNKWFMIDVGHEKEHASVLRILKENNIDELEAIFISHPHKDHASALGKVLKHAKCKTIYITPYEFKDHSPMMREMAGNVPIKTLKAGDSIGIEQIEINVVGPNDVYAEENDNSMVFMLDWKGKKVLFTGDQQAMAEKDLLKSGQPIKCDILKVGHHGKTTASTDEFLKKTGSKFNIITNNFKGEDYANAVERLSKYGSKVFVLGKTGTLMFKIGNEIRYFSITPPINSVPDIKIAEVDPDKKTVTIVNNSDKEVSLYGWSIETGKGENTYFFDDDMVISNREIKEIQSDLFGKFNKKKAVLYDLYGREVCKLKF